MSKIQPIKFLLEQAQTMITICSAQESDAEPILLLRKDVIAEDDFLLLAPEEDEISKPEMVSYINNHIKSDRSIILLAKKDNQIIGVLECTNGHTARIKHTGNIEIYLHKEFRQCWVGTKLIESLFRWVEERSDLEILHLHVHATNQRAINFYTKFGFIKDGLKQKGLKYDANKYVDIILMSKFLKT